MSPFSPNCVALHLINNKAILHENKYGIDQGFITPNSTGLFNGNDDLGISKMYTKYFAVV